MSWTRTMINDNNAVWPKIMRVELAKAIHWDDSKGKREKKEHGSSGISVSDDDDNPGFAVG